MITWTTGGAAEVARLDGDRLSVRSTRSGAPGQTLVGELQGAGTLKLKVARARKLEDGRFELDGRLVDATRELRAAVALALSPPVS